MALRLNIPAAIRKADIATTAALHGCVNSFPVTIDGETYKPRTLKYMVFAGKLVDGLYRGVHCFDQAKTGDVSPAADLNQLPGLTAPNTEHADDVL